MENSEMLFESRFLFPTDFFPFPFLPFRPRVDRVGPVDSIFKRKGETFAMQASEALHSHPDFDLPG